MPHNFVKDKALGDEKEAESENMLHKAGYETERVKGKDNRYDIRILGTNKTIEVKNDLMAAKTGNLAIEISKKSGEKSGIMASEATYWWIHAVGEILSLDREELKDYCGEAQHRVVWGGDNWATQMVLIPIDEIKQLPSYRKLK